MKTYTLSCLLATASEAAAIKWSTPAEQKRVFEYCSSDAECGTGLVCRISEFIYDAFDDPVKMCQHMFGQEGDVCMEPWTPECDVGLECREQKMTYFGSYTCQ